LEDKDLIEQAREKFKLAVEVSRDNRDLALKDIKFALLGGDYQWDDKAVEERRNESRPCITVNKLPAYIRQLVNDARQNKPAIRFRPVDNKSDPATAEVLNGLMRNIETSSNADIAYDTAVHQTASGGFGYIRVNVDYSDDETFDREIKIDRITNQFSVFEDPYAMSADGSDWNCCFVTERVTKKEFEKRYGKNKDQVDFEFDRDDDFEWINDDGVWIAEYWNREEITKQICLLSDGDVVDEEVYDDLIEYYQTVGIDKIDVRPTTSHKVTQYIISGKEVLETNEWKGSYIPIIPVYGEEIIVENKRYFKSLIRDSKGAQMLLNYWRSCTTELIALAPKTPFIGEEKAFSVDSEKWMTANTKSHAFIRHKDGTNPPQRQPFASVPAGAMQEALTADDDIKATMGMFGASIGQQDNATSGRAIIARQRESDTGTFHFIDNLSRSLRQIGRVTLDLIPYVITPGQVIRVVGEDGKETQSIVAGNPQEMQEKMQDISNVYDLTAGKYDVVVDIGPGYTTKRQEAASQMIEYSRVNPAASGMIGDLIAKNLDWPGADEIAERLKPAGENPQIQQLQQQLQQMQQQSSQIQQQAQQMVGQLQNQIEQLKQDKVIDAKKVAIDAYNAETNRFKVSQVGMTPEQIQALVMQTLQQLLQTPDITPAMPPLNGGQQPIQQQPEVIQ